MIKKAIVYTFGDQDQNNTIQTAARFALQHGAELTGLYVRPDMTDYFSIYEEIPNHLVETFYEMQKECESDAEKQFNEVVSKVGCAAQWHQIRSYEEMPRPALYADFLFVTQPSNDTNYIDQLILETGLPTIIVPTDWAGEKFASHPVLGWKETREAVGAVRHTLSLMCISEEVDIVTVTGKTERDEDLVKGIEISAYLSAHDINCKFSSIPVDVTERDESATLLRYSHEENCDLIIIGGYGHSRFRQVILGGVTRGLMRDSDIPILLSH